MKLFLMLVCYAIPAAAQADEIMKIPLEQHISISVPSEFRPAMAALFVDEQTDETLTVDQGRVPTGSHTAADVIADRRREFEGGLREAHVESTNPTILLGRTGELMALRFNIGGRSTYASFAVVLTSPDRYLQISFAASTAEAIGPKFERILASVTQPDAPPPVPKQAGWIHRYAGPVALDVPPNLEPPHAYSFVSADGMVEILVRLFGIGPHVERPPTLQDDISNDSLTGTVVGNPDFHAFAGASGRGELVGYLLTKKEVPESRELAVRRARISLPNGIIVILSATAPKASAAMLDVVFNDLVSSLEPIGH
jgi:hypothetical protein